MKFIFLIAIAIGFIYSLINKPEILSVVLFTFIIAGVNFDLQSLPLNTRAILSLALFARIVVDKTTNIKFSSFLGNPNVKLLLFYLLYVIFISMSQDLFTVDLLKEIISSVLTTYFVFYFFLKNNNANHLKAGVIAAGLIGFADLAYTYIAFGSFPIHRIFEQFTGTDDAVYDDILAGPNWNFFGQICGMGFVYIFCDTVKNRSQNRFVVWLLPVMLLGVIMSTSRSSILGLLVVTILVILNSINYRDQKKRLAKIGTFFVGSAFVALLLFASISKYINLDSKFLDEVISRLSDEPVAIIKRAMGQPYNIQSLGSMDWREESSENAYAAFLNLNVREQIFGIGYGGFEKRSLGHGYNAHNATLLLLIENGFLGFFIYFLLIGSLIFQCIIKKNYSPSLAVIIFILIYGLGQNREWTSVTTYLFVVCMIAELKTISLNNNSAIRQDRLIRGQTLFKTMKPIRKSSIGAAGPAGLYVLGSIYPDITGGMEIFNYYFLNYQLNESFGEIYYISEKKANNERGIFIFLKKRWPVRIFYPFQFLMAVFKVRKRINYAYISYAEQSWIIAFSHSLILRFFKIPYFITIHWGKEPDWKFKSPFIYYFRHARAVIGVSEPVCIAFKKTIPDQDFQYIPPLIPFLGSSSPKQDLKKQLGYQNGEKLILFVGSLKAMKNPDKIIEAFNKIGPLYLEEQNIRLLLAGTGEMENLLKGMIERYQLGKYIRMEGLVNREIMPDYYGAADVYIISSDYEGTSLSLLEAMYNKLIIIGSDAPGINKMLTAEQNALLYETKNTGDLAETIVRIFSDPSLAKSLAERAFMDFNLQYSYESMVKKYQAIFSSVSIE